MAVSRGVEAPASRTDGEESSASDTDMVKLSLMRRRIGAHMMASARESPHVGMGMEIDFHEVELARAAHGTAWRAEEGSTLSYLPFVAWAACRALQEHPHLNAALSGDELIVHRRIHLGIAVDLDFEGLIVPVIRDAHDASVADLAREIARLSALARARSLVPADVSGGTYTISNPGPFGTEFTIPILNQPQVGILSTDGVRKRPVVVSDGEEDRVAIRPVGLAVQSFDHRAVDGAYSASFLRALRRCIASTDWCTLFES